MKADNTDSTALPPVIRAAWVSRSAAEAFTIFTDEIGAWWPLPTHGLFGEQSASVMFRDGHLVEQSIDGSEVTWGRVLAWEPPRRLVVAWHPGRDESQASEVEVSFEADGTGTRVVIEHRGWEVFGVDAAERRLGYVGPNAWGYVIDHYGDGAEVRPDAIDVADLASAYNEFFSEVAQGGFGRAPDGEWNAAQVVAHVALNDAAMLNVCQSLAHQNETHFENEMCQDLDVLARFIEAAGSMDELAQRGRCLADLVLAALARLSPAQRETEVHCRLRHNGESMVDRPLPWHSVAAVTQATVHLPGHVEQLRALRP